LTMSLLVTIFFLSCVDYLTCHFLRTMNSLLIPSLVEVAPLAHYRCQRQQFPL
jgi:hypothetical protein